MHEESHTVIAENERAQKERGNQIQTINAKGIERMRRRKAKELQGESSIRFKDRDKCFSKERKKFYTTIYDVSFKWSEWFKWEEWMSYDLLGHVQALSLRLKNKQILAKNKKGNRREWEKEKVIRLQWLSFPFLLKSLLYFLASCVCLSVWSSSSW